MGIVLIRYEGKKAEVVPFDINEIESRERFVFVRGGCVSSDDLIVVDHYRAYNGTLVHRIQIARDLEHTTGGPETKPRR